MKIINLSIVFILMILSMQIKAQGSRDAELFSRGMALYELFEMDLYINGGLDTLNPEVQKELVMIELLTLQKEIILEKSLSNFEELISSCPRSKLVNRARINAASINLELGDTSEAIFLLKDVLNSRANDMENGGLEAGIMSEPFAMYKNLASKRLAMIYLSQLQFNKALNYLNLTETYPYSHFCGNELYEDELLIASLYTVCYYGMDSIGRAIEYCLPHIIESGLADHHEIIELTIKILSENENLDNLLDKFMNSTDSIYTEIAEISDKDYLVIYKFDFRNFTYQLPYKSQNRKLTDKELKDQIEKCWFLIRLKESVENLHDSFPLYYNGFYMSNLQFNEDSTFRSRTYIKFNWENNEVYSVSSTGSPLQVNIWFDKKKESLSVGNYTIKGDSIYFETKNKYGTVEYQGKLLNGRIDFFTKSNINGFKSYESYYFIEMD